MGWPCDRKQRIRAIKNERLDQLMQSYLHEGEKPYQAFKMAYHSFSRSAVDDLPLRKQEQIVKHGKD